MVKYPLGIQTFSEIREENYLYVDKTSLILELIQSRKTYFLSRPRRFGKSLLISTLEAVFEGQKQLFDGLAIDDSEYDFVQYPVLRFDFSDGLFITSTELQSFICDAVDDYAIKYDITLTRENYTQRFKELISKLHQKTGHKVVLLVDEYDKPILNNLKKTILGEIKATLGTFYASFKSQDSHIKFTFITGVSKFAQVSVFSGMNSLTDISMQKEYASICGITQQELVAHFDDAIKLLPVEFGEDVLVKIKHWYNGYRFHQDADSVYNPYSLLSLFTFKEFKNFWYATATPTFLLNLLQDKQFDLTGLSQFEIGQSAFSASEPEDMDVLSLFVQTGYLTIKGYNKPLYVLDFPNYEVKKSFYDSIATRYGHLGSGLGEKYTHKLVQYIND
ncbi:MAG: AAA family ATPase, partial [Algicola sp.]|nr:AAA family ATPase [Algicola sp.]